MPASPIGAAPGVVRRRCDDQPVRPSLKTLVERDFTAPRSTFTGVILTLGAALTFQLAAPDDDWARLVAIALQGAVVLTALRAAGADHRLFQIARAIVIVLIVIGAGAVIGLDQPGTLVTRSLTLLLVVLAPLAILIGLRRELIADKRITLQTVLAGLSLYLLIGMAFAFSFAIVQDASNDPFFVSGVRQIPGREAGSDTSSTATSATQQPDRAPEAGGTKGGRVHAGYVVGDQNDFLYFSLATLTTTGYGDLTAAGELGRTLAVLEALLGQIYLVTVVALLVSNLRRPTKDERRQMREARARGE